MNPSPKPKQGLSVTRYSKHIALTTHSADAKEFVLDNAPKYGYCILLTGRFSLEVSLEVFDGYDVDEVARYFESYNE